MTEDDHALRDRIERMLAEDLDEVSCVLAPLGLGRHIDHVIVRDLGVGLARSTPVPVLLWEDLPYAGRVDMDALSREIEATTVEIDTPLRPLLMHDEQLEARKQAALGCYPSQVIDVHRRGVLGHLRRLAGHGPPAERLWVATPPRAHRGPSSTAL